MNGALAPANLLPTIYEKPSHAPQRCMLLSGRRNTKANIDVKSMTAKFHAPLISALTFFLSCASCWGQAVDCPPGCSPGRWSNEAVDLSSVRTKAPYETRDIRVLSPDKQKIAHIVKDHWWIEIGEIKISLGPKKSLILYPAELAWAPNSSAFYITEGAGYTTGYGVSVYRLQNQKLRAIADVNQKIQRDFERRQKCTEEQSPNIAGLHWMDDSLNLLIVAEEPSIGICKDAYYFGAYLISIDAGQVVERFTPQAAESRWKNAFGYVLKDGFERLSEQQKNSLP